MKAAYPLLVAALFVGGAPALIAEEKPWEFSLGLSYLATTGNSESQTAGLDLAYKRTFGLWGVEAKGSYLRAEADGDETANSTFLGVRGTRSISERWQLFAGASVLMDEFAGLDQRFVLEGGVTYKAVATEKHALAIDLGAAWTSDDMVSGDSMEYVSGLLGLTYGWTISETAKLSERLAFVPSFEESDDWRLSSETALEAAVSAKLAVKLGFVYLYDNVPVPGFEKTDTRTSASLVVKL